MDRSASETTREGTVEETQVVERPAGGKRPRSATMLKLQWLAERVRKCEKIRKAVAEGSYSVDSREVAKAIMNVKFPSPDEI